MNDAVSKIIVIDDEEVIRYTLQKKLSRLGYSVTSLEKAEDALYLIKNGEKADLIITDIKLRKMDGIELLRRIQGSGESIPVLIITGQGNVEDAIRALRYGASDFIRKPFDINDVAASVRAILKRKHEKMLAESFGQYLQWERSCFCVPIDSGIITPISYYLTRNLVAAGICNHTTAENLTLALQEALSNAMFHGNLEVPSSIREKEGLKAFNEEIERRKIDPAFSSRTVNVEWEVTREYAEFMIEDQGKGFDHRSLPDPRDPENFMKNSGRGLFIIRIHMDEVSWNESGNIIKMKKNRITANDVH